MLIWVVYKVTVFQVERGSELERVREQETDRYVCRESRIFLGGGVRGSERERGEKEGKEIAM